MTTLYRPDVRHKLYNLIGEDDLGFAYTADSVSATGIISTSRFGNSRLGVGQYAGGWHYRPGSTGEEIIKPAGLISGHTLLHTSTSNYTDFTTLGAEWLREEVRPDLLNDMIRRALRRVYFETYAPLTPWDDGDFSRDDVDSWTPTSGCTRAKLAGSTYNLTGYWSLVVTYTSGGAYCAPPASLRLNVQPKQRLWLTAQAMVVSGTGAPLFRIWGYDASGNSTGEIGTAPVVSGAGNFHLGTSYTIPDGTYAIGCRLESSGAGVIAWDALPGHRLTQRRFKAPSWLDANFKLIDLLEAEYDGLSTTQNVREPESKRYRPWTRPQDFEAEVLGTESSPGTFQVNRDGDLPEADLWYNGWRAWSDQDPAALQDETTSTDAPEDQLIVACGWEMGDFLYRRTQEQRWADYRTQCDAWLAAQRQARRPQMQRRAAVSYHVPGGRPGGRQVFT